MHYCVMCHIVNIIKVINYNTLNKFEATENEALNTMANCLLQVIKRYESQVDAYKAADIVHKSVMINIPKMYETDGNG